MHNLETEIARFIRGERRDEGWKSSWRIEFERRAAEEQKGAI